MALDPERLLWRPGAKLISIPARPVLNVETLRMALEEFHRQVMIPQITHMILYGSVPWERPIAFANIAEAQRALGMHFNGDTQTP